MKDGWELKPISEIADHSLGKMLDKAKNRGDLKPYLRNVNVRWWGFDLSDVLEMRFLPEEVEKYSAKKGDVLVCEGGYPGRSAIWDSDESIFIQKALHRVRFHEPDRNKWFVYYLQLRDMDGSLREHFSGAGIQHFTGQSLAKLQIPLPPLAEQQRIVAILDKAFEGIATAKANAEKSRQNAKSLFESHLQSIFTQRAAGWSEASMAEVVADDCTLSYGIVQPGDNVEGGMPVVRPTDLVADVIVLKGLKRIDPKRAESYGRTTLQGGELLLCVRGSTGVLSKASEELIGANVTRGIVPIRFNQKLIRQDFGYHLLRSDPVQAQIRAKTYGAALMQINIGDLRQITVKFPAIEEQKDWADKLDSLAIETTRLSAIYEQKTATLDDLKKSLLHHAFSGQL